MNLNSRVAYVEELQRRERGRRPQSVEAATDTELEGVICDALGCTPAELTDELIEAVARGEA